MLWNLTCCEHVWFKSWFLTIFFQFFYQLINFVASFKNSIRQIWNTICFEIILRKYNPKLPHRLLTLSIWNRLFFDEKQCFRDSEKTTVDNEFLQISSDSRKTSLSKKQKSYVERPSIHSLHCFRGATMKRQQLKVFTGT